MNKKTERALGRVHLGIKSSKTPFLANNFFKKIRHTTVCRIFYALFFTEKWLFWDAKQFCTGKILCRAQWKNAVILPYYKAFSQVIAEILPSKTFLFLIERALTPAVFNIVMSVRSFYLKNIVFFIKQWYNMLTTQTEYG